MIKFNDDELISALLIAGFDRVDVFLLRKVKQALINSGQFSYVQEKPSKEFLKVVPYRNGYFYSEGDSIFDAIYHDQNKTYLVADNLPKNIPLIRYVIYDIDYRSIINDKASMYITNGGVINQEQFSLKEIQMLNLYFGINIKDFDQKTRSKRLLFDFNNLSSKDLQLIISNYSNTFIVDLLNDEAASIVKRECSPKINEEVAIEFKKNFTNISAIDDQYEDFVLIQIFNESVAESCRVRNESSRENE